ncbi:hypothetical protein [Denitratisoma oestradiolicum]|uniref:Uncharacterized protein n=1 Tax=Denitratisoma oestradiolicum TaxID=311182 RepID=A0A6S6XVP8_9PROT|nr:hypothetical protein [Denitratisoma oestradiolicum]CAB1368293.1 protein of unknown function [Denitratisoma oestradiolicum]
MRNKHTPIPATTTSMPTSTSKPHAPNLVGQVGLIGGAVMLCLVILASATESTGVWIGTGLMGLVWLGLVVIGQIIVDKQGEKP